MPLAPEETIARILIGEAVGEGPEGMEFVRDIGVNRSLQSGKPLIDVFTAKNQFAAYARPDLEEFYLKQPEILRNLALEYAREALKKGFVPKYEGVTHYEAQKFWDRRHEKPPTHWYHSYEPAGKIGNHVLLKPKKKR